MPLPFLSIQSRLYLYLAPLLAVILLLFLKSSAVYREMLDHSASAELDARSSVFARRLSSQISRERGVFWEVVSTEEESDEDRWNEAGHVVEATLSAWKSTLHRELARKPEAAERMELELLLAIENDYAGLQGIAAQAYEHARRGKSGQATSLFAELDRASYSLQQAISQLGFVEETECRKDLAHLASMADHPGVTFLKDIPRAVSAVDESFSELMKAELFANDLSGLMEAVSDLAATEERDAPGRAIVARSKAERALADWKKWRAGLARPRLAELRETEGSFQQFCRLVEPVIEDKNLTTRRALLRESSDEMDGLAAVLLTVLERLQSGNERTLDSDLERLIQKVNRARIELALVSFTVLLIGVGSPVLVSRSIVRPIVALRNAFTRLETGSPGSRVEWVSRDEIGELARGFDLMAESLAERDRSLRSEIDQRERLVRDLQAALAEVKTLQGIIPICASCKKIRDDTGSWRQMELYIRDHSGAQFSHGICPECLKKLYPEFASEEDSPGA